MACLQLLSRRCSFSLIDRCSSEAARSLGACAEAAAAAATKGGGVKKIPADDVGVVLLSAST